MHTNRTGEMIIKVTTSQPGSLGQDLLADVRLRISKTSPTVRLKINRARSEASIMLSVDELRDLRDTLTTILEN